MPPKRKSKTDETGFVVDDTPGPAPDDVAEQNVPEDYDGPDPEPDLPADVGEEA